MVNLARKIAARLHQDISGQGLVEYALIMALVVFAAVTTMREEEAARRRGGALRGVIAR